MDTKLIYAFNAEQSSTLLGGADTHRTDEGQVEQGAEDGDSSDEADGNREETPGGEDTHVSPEVMIMKYMFTQVYPHSQRMIWK